LPQGASEIESQGTYKPRHKSITDRNTVFYRSELNCRRFDRHSISQKYFLNLEKQILRRKHFYVSVP